MGIARGRLAAALAAIGVAAAFAPGGAAAYETCEGSVCAEVTASAVELRNQVALRRFDRQSFRTVALTDRRAGGRPWGGARADFALTLAGGLELNSRAFAVRDAAVTRLARGGLRVEMRLVPRPGRAPVPGIEVDRTVEGYPGVAGFRSETLVRSTLPLVVAGATLDEAPAGAATPTIHSLRAGADWREPDWTGPPIQVGDPHAGTWRDSRSAGRGQPLRAAGQWVSAADGGRSVFLVMERNDQPSSRAAYDGARARLELDFSRDVIGLGPLEEEAHLENPSDAQAGRTRTVGPHAPLRLEPAFTGLGSGAGDEAWQFHRYLTGHRLLPYANDVTFNSNGTDSDVISTGAKDDMNLATVKEVAPIARRLGVDTFILDDGWQAISGDWQPDSPQYPEPRWDGSRGSKFAPRFPDSRFEAVREAIAPMKLGLWMSPLSFNPKAKAYAEHPEWTCAPVGHGTATQDRVQPDEGSSEAGTGQWGREAVPHVEARIRDAIENWGVSYFKFDFLVWLDCAGQGDFYDHREAFIAMLDRLRRDHPSVTFQIDETNDYRLFPFESVTRGPSWFQNGSPPPDRLLHNLWNLSPYVPAFSLGQHALGGRAYRDHPVPTLMAASLLSHVTFFTDLRELPPEVVDAAAPWTAFHRRHRDLLDGVVYPLLSDPLEKGWTALQSWDPDKGEGALLAFRQDAGEASRRIALRNVPPGRRFRLLRAPDGTEAGVVTSEQLAGGIDVEIPERRGAQVLLVVAE